jgi:hypothetical protein
MQYYLDNQESLYQFKRKSFSYANENLSWNKNFIHLSDILTKVSSFSFEKKIKIYNQVKNYENSRGIWFYVANTKFYRRLKSRLINILKILGS